MSEATTLDIVTRLSFLFRRFDTKQDIEAKVSSEMESLNGEDVQKVVELARYSAVKTLVERAAEAAKAGTVSHDQPLYSVIMRRASTVLSAHVPNHADYAKYDWFFQKYRELKPIFEKANPFYSAPSSNDLKL